MARYALIDGYLDSVRTNIRFRRDLDDLVAEMEDHLYSAVEYLTATGVDPADAQRATLDRFGDPERVAVAYASNNTGGMAVPTRFTRNAGTVALVAAAFWLLSLATYVLVESADNWELIYSILTASVVVAGVLTVVAVVGIGKRVGGLGVIGLVAIVIMAVGVLLSFVAWAVILWMTIQGIGLLVFGISLLRKEGVPRSGVLAISSGFILGPIAFVVLDALAVGTQNTDGDNWLAFMLGAGLGFAIVSLGLVTLGVWLRSEEAVDLDRGTPVAA